MPERYATFAQAQQASALLAGIPFVDARLYPRVTRHQHLVWLRDAIELEDGQYPVLMRGCLGARASRRGVRNYLFELACRWIRRRHLVCLDPEGWQRRVIRDLLPRLRQHPLWQHQRAVTGDLLGLVRLLWDGGEIRSARVIVAGRAVWVDAVQYRLLRRLHRAIPRGRAA